MQYRDYLDFFILINHCEAYLLLFKLYAKYHINQFLLKILMQYLDNLKLHKVAIMVLNIMVLDFHRPNSLNMSINQNILFQIFLK